MHIFKTPFTTIWKNRQLVRKLTARKIANRYRASVLGIVWSVLDPLLLLGVYLFVFGYIFGGSFRSDGSDSKMDYAITVFIGLSIYRLLSEIMAVSPLSIISSTSYVKKIVFPLIILPLVDVFKAVHSFFLSMLLLLISSLIFGEGFGINILWWFFLLPCLLLFLTGVAWLLSSLTVYFRDISNLIQVLTVSLLFGSAIFYPIDKIPADAWIILKYNPVLQFVEVARRITIWNSAPNYSVLIYLLFISVFLFYVGYALFLYLKKGFADVL